MRTGKRALRHWAWVACLAILVNALAPTVSHALADRTDRAQGLIEVCTAYGIALLPVGDDGSKGPLGGVSDEGVCGYCAAHAGSFALPAAVTEAGIDSTPTASRPLLASCAGANSRPWTAPPPRGPPCPT